MQTNKTQERNWEETIQKCEQNYKAHREEKTTYKPTVAEKEGGRAGGRNGEYIMKIRNKY